MTWWGALGLALSLYGVMVMLERVYERIVRVHSQTLTPISVVVRFGDQEAHMEYVLRELRRVFGLRPWNRQSFEVVLADQGSHDHSPAIIERLFGHHPYFRLEEPGLSDQEVMERCHHPIILWLDLSRPTEFKKMIATVERLLGGSSAG